MSSSEQWGGSNQNGKYAVKIYTVDGVLIYQDELGGDNTDKASKGGVIYQSSPASSMLDAIANPITFYGGTGDNRIVINQEGYSRDLYTYYWTSYSRGTDGSSTNPSGHNVYLDGYIPLRVKSIYDPCPYLYRIPSNGTFNQFTFNPGWTVYSYLGGASWNMNSLGKSWLSGLGGRNGGVSNFFYFGGASFYRLGTTSEKATGYVLDFNSSNGVYTNQLGYARSYGMSVRCIEDLQDISSTNFQPQNSPY